MSNRIARNVNLLLALTLALALVAHQGVAQGEEPRLRLYLEGAVGAAHVGAGQDVRCRETGPLGGCYRWHWDHNRRWGMGARVAGGAEWRVNHHVRLFAEGAHLSLLDDDGDPGSNTFMVGGRVYLR